jgi:hypothetical protein
MQCDACRREIGLAKSCGVLSIVIDGVYYIRVPFGKESLWTKPEEKNYAPQKIDRCCGCGVAFGEFHHVGCQEEECPKCHQLIFDGCRCGVKGGD